MRSLRTFIVTAVLFACFTVTQTASALQTDVFCNVNTNDPSSCLAGDYPAQSDGYWACNGQYFNAVVMLRQMMMGPTWYEAIQTLNCPHIGAPGCNSITSFNLVIQGTPAMGGWSYLPMTHGNGFLYLSQNVALRMTRYYGTGAGVDVPITLLAGNLQYYPASATYPHGRWFMWITAPYQPSEGVCGNIALSWSPPGP